jgi:hypothetical protein
MKTTKPQPETLEDRILAFRQELEAYIDKRVADLKAETPGVPEVVLRRLIENRAPNCPCAQSLELLRT